MKEILFGIAILFIGIMWLVNTIRKMEKWNDPRGFIINFKGFMGSLMTIFLGLAFILGYLELSMFW